VLSDPAVDIVGESNVKFSLAVLNDVNAITHRGGKLVAGAGFEPAIRQLPDYEPLRGRPVIE